MPVTASVTKRGRRTFKEFGCGHYGCVFPTTVDNMVFKLTSDASEAAFVATALKLPDWPDGMIRYHRIVELSGEKHRRRRAGATLAISSQLLDRIRFTHGGFFFMPCPSHFVYGNELNRDQLRF